MPAIAAQSAQFAPTFYWHLGALRAIYKIDKNMAFAAAKNNQIKFLVARAERLARPDFITNQIASFGNVPFSVGIGNHEVLSPQTADWLELPSLREQRLKDKELAQPEPTYHWIQGGVDFIYLDNASNSFSQPELTWLKHRLGGVETDSDVKSVVVGMHEALPDNIGNSHSMGDAGAGVEGRSSGEQTYEALENFRDHTHPDGSKSKKAALAELDRGNGRSRPLCASRGCSKNRPNQCLRISPGHGIPGWRNRFFFSRSTPVRYPAICSAALSGCADSLVLRTQLASSGTRNCRHNLTLCAA